MIAIVKASTVTSRMRSSDKKKDEQQCRSDGADGEKDCGKAESDGCFSFPPSKLNHHPRTQVIHEGKPSSPVQIPYSDGRSSELIL